MPRKEFTISTTITVVFRTPRLNWGKQERLRAAAASYRDACQFFVQEAVQHDTTSRNTLHRTSYAAACARSRLNPATVQLALEKALGALRSHHTRVKQGRTSALPSFIRVGPFSIRRDYHRLVHTERGSWLIHFPVARQEPRIMLPLVVGEYQRRRLRELQEGHCRQGPLECWEGPDGSWRLAVTLVYPTKASPTEHILGVDLGLVKTAVVSNNRFFRGKAARWRRERWAARRKALQEAGRLARVKREAGRERRWTRNLNHQLSRRLVQLAQEAGQGLALERLTHIGERTHAGRQLNRELHSGWPFRQLGGFVQYKAELAGILFITVDPRHSSRACSRCGHTAPANRKTQGWFHCKRCGFQLDADLNAARNLADRGHAARGL